MKRQDIPPLEGWMTLPQAAHKLGLTRQGVHRLISIEQLSTIRRLGDTVKPIYVISEKEVTELAATRASNLVEVTA